MQLSNQCQREVWNKLLDHPVYLPEKNAASSCSSLDPGLALLLPGGGGVCRLSAADPGFSLLPAKDLFGTAITTKGPLSSSRRVRLAAISDTLSCLRAVCILISVLLAYLLALSTMLSPPF